MAVAEADSTWAPPVKGGRWLSAAVITEAFSIEARRLMVWSPLLLVLGIWGYFALDREPPFWMAPALAIGCGAVLIWSRSRPWLRVICIVALGFSLAQLRTAWVATPLLRAYTLDQTITGRVADVDVRSSQRFTLVVAITEAKGLPVSEIPRRVLVQVTGKTKPPRVGDLVRLEASLAPLPRPSQPGAFDYGRQLFFQSIGAMGRSSKPLEILDQTSDWSSQLRRSFHDLRSGIGARIRAAIPGPLGSFADALITGERATIPRNMNESLQNSGLFHILSISGLHMALVAGGAFWALRALLALSPTLALQYPIKKWAAGFAIAVGLLYMLLADSGAATERSFIMIAVVFFAVLVDRPALSMHNLALAAVLILLWSPEQALSASFQMSFMAVMGLAAFFAHWRKWVPEASPLTQRSFARRWSRRIALAVLVSVFTSLVAGALSGIPAAHHFGRIAPYGVVANALALPVVSLIVMPAAMASVLLMPLGLETLPLQVMGGGLQLVMWVSDWVSSWPAAGMRLPLLPAHAAALMALAVTFGLLPQSKLRWLAPPVMVLAAVAYFAYQSSPLLLIDERAGNVAVVTDHGIVPALVKGASASVSRWLAHHGDNANVKQAAQRKAWKCDVTRCLTNQHGVSIGFLLKQPLASFTCPKVEVLVAQDPLRRRCKGSLLTIDRFDVWRNGSHAVTDDKTVVTARGLQGQRPWVYEPRARSKPN